MALVVTGVMKYYRALMHRFQYYWSASGHDGARCHNKADQELFENNVIKAAKMVHEVRGR